MFGNCDIIFGYRVLTYIWFVDFFFFGGHILSVRTLKSIIVAALAPKDYWNRMKNEEFTRSLDLREPSKTVPLVWHVDGVKIYKNQKIWVYSYSSMVRKSGNSLENKTVLAIIRDNLLAKPETHDAMAAVIAYICKTLQTGRYPTVDWKGAPWPPNSRESSVAGKLFTKDCWRCCFSAFKGDLEARVMIHKMVRNYMANMICEHCPAGKLLNYPDFRKNAPWASVRFSHQDFLDLNPPNRQSAWVLVPGWRKERNLEENLISKKMVWVKSIKKMFGA